MTKNSLSSLRRQLSEKLEEIQRLLKPAFDSAPLLPGVITTSRHRCGNSGCACEREGKLHESVRMLLRFKDGYATRCLSKEGLEFFSPRIEAYRRLRRARRDLGKWYKQVVELIDSLERERRSVEGLSEEDRKRPLR